MRPARRASATLTCVLHRVARLLLLAALAVAPGACGGNEQPAPFGAQPPSATAEGETVPAPAPTPEPQVGLMLSRFTQAAADGDTAALWELLSSESRQRLGPTIEDFAQELGPKFQGGLGAFAGTDYELVLAVEMPSGWGVAAIAGVRERDGREEFATYAAAFRRESGEWKIELGAPLDLIRVKPEGTQTAEARPDIVIRIDAATKIEEAGLWLDGEPLPAKGRSADGREVVIAGQPDVALSPGNHVVVIFAESGDTANAGSMPVDVRSPEIASPTV